MKKNLIILLVIINSLDLYAQDKSNNFRIGINLNLENNLSSNNVAFDKYTGYSANYNKINYKIGLNAEYELKNGFSLNSGINYSNKDFTGTFYCAVCDFIIPPSPEKIEFRFIEIPISLRYYFLSSKLKIFADVGITNQFLLKGPTNQIFLNGENGNNKYIIGGKFGGGLEYNISREFAIQLITEYNRGFSNIFKESDFKINTISFGVGIVKKI
jgi:outer membrane protein with beta-barrel domain